jgi:hypothetical protein
MNKDQRSRFNDATNRLLGAEKVLEAINNNDSVRAKLIVFNGKDGEKVTLATEFTNELLAAYCVDQATAAREELKGLL